MAARAGGNPRRWGAARIIIVVGLLVVVLGGAGFSLHSRLQERQAEACSTGNQCPAAPQIAPRRALAAAALDGRVYAVGGWDGATTQLATVEVRDPESGQWHAAPSLTVARSQHGMVAAGGKLWVLGGWSAHGGLVAPVETFAPGQATWTVATNLPTPRREPGVALLGRRIVVAGGFNGASDADADGYTDRVEAYDLDSGRWQTLAPLPTPRRGLALVAAGDALYAIGGYAAGAGYVSAGERYDPAADRWTTLAWPIIARTWAAAVTTGGAIVVLGGYDTSGVLGTIERIEPESGRICHPPPLPTPRAWLAAVPLPDGILTMGGEERGGIDGTVETVTAACRDMS